MDSSENLLNYLRREMQVKVGRGRGGALSQRYSNRLTAINSNIKCIGENVILRGIFHVVSRFPPHFMLYRVNFDNFSYSVGISPGFMQNMAGISPCQPI